jgi:uncharacterized protein
MSIPHWRTVCRQAAAEQAIAEARSVWHLPADQPLPFDHRWEHVQEVVRLALQLTAATGADAEIVEAAAWLHDVCKGQRHHATLGAAAAERILATTDFPAAKISTVAEAIRQHEGLIRPADTPPLEPLEAAVLWDADKLSKIGVQALAFLLSAHYLFGRTLADRRRNCQDYVTETLSRTVTSMNTPPARRLAEERYAHMVQMLALWAGEEEKW